MHLITGYFRAFLPFALHRITGLLPILLVAITPMAAVAAETPQNFDQIQSEAALARLSDSELRELLLQRLENTEAMSAETSSFNPMAKIEQLQQRFGIVQNRLFEIISVRHRVKQEFSSAWALISGADEGGTFITLILVTLTALFLAWLAEKAFTVF